MAISRIASATNTGTGTAVSVTHGMTLAAGDVLEAVVHANSNPTISDNNGAAAWTQVAQRNGAGSNRVAIFRRTVTGSEGASFAFALNSSQAWSLQVVQYRGVHTDVYDVTPSDSTVASGNSALATSSDETTLTDGAMAVVLVLTDGTVTYSGPTNGFADEVEVGNMPQATYRKEIPTAGAVGAVSVTLSGSNDWLIYQYAFKPAEGGGDPPEDPGPTVDLSGGGLFIMGW